MASVLDLLHMAIAQHNLCRSTSSLIAYLTFLNKLNINEHGALKCRFQTCNAAVVHSEKTWITAISEGCLLADQASRMGWTEYQPYMGWLGCYGECQKHASEYSAQAG
ncbi:uncharacterized protein RCC_08180 [Ramularia collo-cygni]|uniref:Uncharacterized protein n=1 Tax=Ramularia collo-cygni TaxID=112498 RepID=A0A2D3UZG0_9PEZI|nr:uncharacterized protein RCC_08180 [Ramularia collo-cygni]CZT22311.1 uncharacterized protein RCC_08180 [Ramularia collo-cygni]